MKFFSTIKDTFKKFKDNIITKVNHAINKNTREKRGTAFSDQGNNLTPEKFVKRDVFSSTSGQVKKRFIEKYIKNKGYTPLYDLSKDFTLFISNITMSRPNVINNTTYYSNILDSVNDITDTYKIVKDYTGEESMQLILNDFFEYAKKANLVTENEKSDRRNGNRY